MFIIDSLTVAYGRNVVLEGLDLALEPQSVHGLVGLNGSGKTTLFNTIYGLKKKEAGRIIWQERPVKRLDIALLETQNYFYSNITGLEYLNLFPHSGDSFDTKTWQQLFDLPLSKLIESYSTGMKKKLALLGVLKLKKPVMLLDEPFNGIDLETSRILKLIIYKLKAQGTTIIITSHVLGLLTDICDYIHHLNHGKIEKTYQKSAFDSLDSAIFSQIDGNARPMIDRLM